ncbi:MAG: PIN domain-containing protein [Flavobacteriaceae bacterium]|nr:PIN domain-containing protein [Flavobacteriaceae bacterium]
MFDTNIIINYTEGKSFSKENINFYLKRGGVILISERTQIELYRGYLLPKYQHQKLEYEKVQSRIIILPCDIEIQEKALQIFKKLNLQPKDWADVLIASTAIKYDIPLITNDDDFYRISMITDLKIENWHTRCIY